MSDNRKVIDADDIGHNDSPNTEFDTVLKGFLSRRGMLKGGVGTAATLLLGGGLAACGSDDTPAPPVAAAPPPAPPPPPAPAPAPSTLQLNFDAVPKSTADALTVPAGYTATPLYALGDPLSATLPEYSNNGGESGASFAMRAGDHHDGMNYFGLGDDGKFSPQASTRGLICINHENITINFLHIAGPTVVGGVRMVPDEVLKEINAHGVAVFEVARAANGSVSVVRNSVFNRRITPTRRCPSRDREPEASCCGR
jgi:secreted PhoX family phosphatase